ncbi:putative tartrate transporter [Hyphomicrobiales bacterium]|nr:putative tartrate transporter [Hyphomicrobiales bacterium]CAH1700472.1 Putative tartrate transporter [Hyphomicrobiales bacterium]CAI0343647.1 putative tartrate transporter [Hyphomicrobiales bacterium]
MSTAVTHGADISEGRSSQQLDAAFSKVTWRLIPFLMILWILAWIDRVNIGFAKLQMLNDLKFSEAIYGLGAGIFFIGYFLFEVPSNLLLERIGARKTIARITILWGLTCVAMMFVTTPTQFYVLRFLLGVFEAGFYPGVILYLTYWYPTERRAKAFGLFMSASALAGVLGGPLAGTIMTQLNGANGWAGWQWVFLIEGIPSVIAGIVTLFYMTDKPEKASWLTENEKNLILADLERDRAALGPREHKIMKSLRDPRVWHFIAIYFCIILANSTLTFWGPTVVREVGFTSPASVGWIMAVAYLCGAAGMILIGRSSDRYREARLHCGFAALLGGVSMAVLGFLLPLGSTLSLVALTLAIIGTMSAIPVFWQMPNQVLSGSAAAAGVALINSVANLAGFGAPFAMGVIKDATGLMSPGFWLVALFEAATLFLIVKFIPAFNKAGSK